MAPVKKAQGVNAQGRSATGIGHGSCCTAATSPEMKAQDSANPLYPSPTGSDELKMIDPDSAAPPAQGTVADADTSSSPLASSSEKPTRKRTPTLKAAATPDVQKKIRGVKAPAAKQVKHNSRAPKRKAGELEADDADNNASAEAAPLTSPTKIKKLRLSPPKKPVRGKVTAAAAHDRKGFSVAVTTKIKAVLTYMGTNTPILEFEPETRITTLTRQDLRTALTLLQVHFEIPNDIAHDMEILVIEVLKQGVHEDLDFVRVDLGVETATEASIRDKLTGHENREVQFLWWELEKLAIEQAADVLLGAVDAKWRDENGLSMSRMELSAAQEEDVVQMSGFRGA